MSISVVIIHAAPALEYLEVLKKTITSIRAQNYAGEVEIIVADDGSLWSQELLADGEESRAFDRDEIRNNPLLKDLSVDAYIVARSSETYLKASLWNRAVAIARHDKLVFLDDDHPFASTKALQRYADLLDGYEFVFGRIRNPDKTYRRFGDLSVQGTNFAMRRDLFNRIGGFGDYTAEWGCGEDSDLFWKVYKELAPDSNAQKRAFFAGNIVTNDLCSGRWFGCRGGPEKCIEGFQNLHGVNPLSNPSRDKRSWVVCSASEYWLDFCSRLNNFYLHRFKGV